jgi:hypothetical protein
LAEAAELVSMMELLVILTEFDIVAPFEPREPYRESTRDTE